jgi:hypothetical protein
MVRILKSLVFLIIVLFYATGLRAQYVNVDSLMHVPGHENPVLLNEFYNLMEDLPVDDFLTGQDFFYGHYIPAGNLLKHFAVPSGGKVISRYGWRSGRMHTGTDLKMAKGDTIYAAFHGTVLRSKYYYGYGNMVVIDHGNTIETSYAHLSAFLVKSGDVVSKNQPIGLAGSTGRASTSHLHFEIREAGKHFNPELVFDFEEGIVREEAYDIWSLADLLPANRQSTHSYEGTIPQNYTVATGDSLWKISRRFKTTVKTLCQLNGLEENSVLSVGMVLKLF